MVAGTRPASLHLELVLKVRSSEEERDRVWTGPDRERTGPASRRKRTLLSFQRPGRRGGVKKGPDSRQRPRNHRSCSVPNRLEALRCSRFQGLSYAARSGSRGIVAPGRPVSTRPEPKEASLARLQERPVE